MSRYLNFTQMVAIAAILVTIAGCGGDDAPGGNDGGSGGGDAPAEMPFDVATAGNISGSVMFEGTAPPPEVLNMASEADCVAQYSADPTVSWVNSSGGGLADVFVYVREGLEGMSFPIPTEAVGINQQGCQYRPLVSGVQIGQTLTIQNSDGLLHNINASPTMNRPFNISQPVNMETGREFAAAEVMVPIQCDVHGWMAGYIGVVSHPYHAVSGSGGSFNLSQLPPGDYVIEAWHSRLGTQEQTITVTTGQTAEVTFTFTEAMLSSAEPKGDPLDLHDHGSFETLVGE
jgi:plastocyanin